MKPTEHFIESWDGARFFYRAWLPETGAKKALFLFHRGHEHSGRWDELVKAVERPDMAIFAWDARGHGRSDGPRGYAGCVSDLEKDVELFARHIWQAHNIRAEDTIVLAHSLAAVTVSAWVHDYAPPLRGLILATAAFRVKLYVPLALPALRIRQSLLGEGQVKSFVRGSMLTRLPEEAERYNNDPLIFRQISTGLLIDLHDTASRVVADAGAIQTPTLMLVAKRDWVVRQDAQQKFFNGLSSPVKRLKVFPTACHGLFHDAVRTAVFQCIRDFVGERFAETLSSSTSADALASAHTWREYEGLQNGNGGSSRFAFARAGLRAAGRLSDGIATGWRTGFDSGASLDYVYRNEAHGSLGVGRLIDRSYLNTIGWRGIRQRRTNLQAALRWAIQAIHDEGRDVRILDIAAGVGRYVIETIASLPNILVRACLRDYQEENIDRIRVLADEFRLTDIVAERKDAFDRASFTDFQPRATIGLVSGLYELFPSNEMVVESLAGLAEAIEPEGFLIYTNQPWHPQMEFIARVLRNHRGKPWVMRRRTTAEMDQLVARAGFQKLNMHIDRWGMFTVSIARRMA
jgi:alpha-beta hydrolase superfamily lysophospholipase